MIKHLERLAKIQATAATRPVNQTVNQTSQTVHEPVKDHVFDAVNLSRAERKRQLLNSLADIYIDDPDAKVTVVANKLNVSRQTVYNYLNELEQTGKISRNGNGIEVIR